MKECGMKLTDEFRAAWRAGVSLDGPLSRLVVETASRAAGCWRLAEDHLDLIGFGWASGMPGAVSQGFQDATRHLSLDQVGLGVVKAAISRKPAIGRRDAGATGLDGSASWIARFEANTSLAVPIEDSTTHCVVGVLAVSTAAYVEEGDSLWLTLIQMSQVLGQSS